MTPWPNKNEIVDGVTPVDKVPQDADAFELDDEDLEMEMDD